MKSEVKKILKGENGITLVALVVTIVILLILAGVSLNLVLSNNGIISKAKDARNKTAEAQKNEELALNNISDWMDEQIEGDTGGSSSGMTLVEAFNKGILNVGDYLDYKNPTKVMVTGEGYTETGYTSPASKTGALVENGAPEDMNQTYTLDSTTRWRVLGLSEDGTQLMLISADPLISDTPDMPGFYLYGAEGAAYGVNEINKICAIYKNNYAENVKGLTIDEVNRLCEVTVDIQAHTLGDETTQNISKVYKTADETKTNIDLGGNLGEKQEYTNQYASPEDFLAGKTTPSFSKTSDAYYYVGSDAIDDNSKLYEMLFANTDSKPYWLASGAVYVLPGYCYFGPGSVYFGCAGSCSDLFYSVGYVSVGGLPVRSVVYLKSNVKYGEMQKIADPM